MKYDRAVIAATVRSGAWFRSMPESAIQALASKAYVKSYSAGQFIYLPGEVQENVVCVLSGRIRVAVTSNMAQEFVLVDLPQGSWLGESSLVGEKARVLEASAVAEAEVLLIPAKHVLSIADKFPLFYKDLFAHQMRRTALLYDVFAGILFYPLKARLAGRLIDLASRHGEAGVTGITLDLHMTQLDFARMSMGSRQRVNKIFRNWVKAGVLEKSHDKYVIKDIDALRSELEITDGD